MLQSSGRRIFKRVGSGLSFAIFALFSIPVAAANCQDLLRTNLPATTISTAEIVPAGSFTPPGGSTALRDLPVFCRVAGVIKPTADSEIKFEVWMPASGWNGKFHGIGNGGFAGSISYSGLAGALVRGYAAASTDTGHSGGDATWALGHPEKLVDYGHRAIHEMTEKAKLILAAYFGSGPKRSYFSSCSNGGRQALMEAQRYPNDYDGIIAGAPANSFTRILTGFAWNLQATLKEPDSYIPASKLKAIEAAALSACDGRDGVTDGVIDDPTKCRFDPNGLLCKGQESDQCLTVSQVAALRKVYSGPRNSKGEQITAGFLPGGETGQGGWSSWVTGTGPRTGAQFFFATQAFRYLVHQNPDWDFQTFDVDKDGKLADERLAPIINATDPNLKAFKARGGKLILYHGWNDAALPPLNTVNYVKSVAKTMGQRQTDQFVRLYMVPGLQHCAGGPGPNTFGAQVTPQQGDQQNDLTKALERWVEEGIAPDKIVASRRQNPAPGTPALRTRPLCPYPQVAKYKGSGSTDEASNFTCGTDGTTAKR